MSEKFSVISNQGECIAQNLTAYDAAVEILLHDGHQFEIRPAENEDGHDLWVSRASRNSPIGGRPLVKSAIFSIENDKALAERDIAGKVIAARWRGYPEAIFDVDVTE